MGEYRCVRAFPRAERVRYLYELRLPKYWLILVIRIQTYNLASDGCIQNARDLYSSHVKIKLGIFGILAFITTPRRIPSEGQV